MAAAAEQKIAPRRDASAVIFNFYAEKFRLREGLSGRFQIRASLDTHDILMAAGAQFRALNGQIQNEQV